MNVEAAREEDTGPIVSAVAVESNAANLHLICESPLFKKDRAIVPMEALALQAHNAEDEKETVVLPPIRGTSCSACVCSAKWSCSHYWLCGQRRSDSGALAPGGSSPFLDGTWSCTYTKFVVGRVTGSSSEMA